MAHELVPAATLMALLLNPTDPAQAGPQLRDLQAAAGKLGLQLNVLHASTEREIDEAFATVAQLRAGALVIGGDPFFNSRSQQLGELTLRYSVPTIYEQRQFAVAGGMISYSGSLTESYRLAGVYTGRILKGDKPADLPVQAPTKYELTINLKTAKALGIEVPLFFQQRADEVIE
jgi:putative tryptophan/tyrosine transport system substrate-binding protein